MSSNDAAAGVASDGAPGAMDLPYPLILGSGSFTRKLILKEMGLDFTVIVRPIDEDAIGGDRELVKRPKDLVLKLAKAKADHLCEEILAGRTELDASKPYIILTGDQVVIVEREKRKDDTTVDDNAPQWDILEKPAGVAQAKEFVARYGTTPPSTVGSCVLTHIPSGVQVSGTDTATIHFDAGVATSDLVDRLLAEDEPILSCAGGLMVEHPFVREYVREIDGTEDSVMGLSKDLVRRLTHELLEQVDGATIGK